jgi:hypothetical protein
VPGFEPHIVFPATVFTYEDGRRPWFVITNVRGSHARCAAPIDETRCLIVGSENDIAIVDVMSQRILATTSFPASPRHNPELVLSKDRKSAVIYSRGLNGVALIRFEPLTVTFFDRVYRTDTDHRYLASADAPSIGHRMSSGFYNAGFKEDGRIVLTKYSGAYYEDSAKSNRFIVLDPDTGNVETHAFDSRFDFPVKGWFSPSGRWLLAVRQASVEYVPSSPTSDSVANGPPSNAHPDLLADEKHRWGLQLELWDMTTWELKKIIASRFYEERELWNGWLLDFPHGENDVMWRFADWFGFPDALSPSRAEELGSEEARAYNERRAQQYATAREAAEDQRSEYIRKLIFMGQSHAQSRREYQDLTFAAAKNSNFKVRFALDEREWKDLFERIMDVAWFEDERSFAVLFSDGMVREIAIDGSVAELVRLERFQQETWYQLGSPRKSRSYKPRAGKVAAIGGRKVRVFGYRGGPLLSPLSQLGYVEVNLTDGSRLITHEEDGFVDISFGNLREEITEAANAANQYRIVLPDLSEPSCIRAIEQLTSDLNGDLEAILLQGHYEPFFKLPDRVVPEEEFFQHVTKSCPNAVTALRGLLATLLSRWRSVSGNRGQILWRDESTEALAHAVAALVVLDPSSFDIAKRYFDELDYGHTVYFRGRFFEDVAPSGRWQDPRWLPLALRHLSGDFAGDHWVTLGFREAFTQLRDAKAFLELFCAEFDSQMRPKAEASAARYPSYIATRERYRAEYVAKGQAVPLNYAIEHDDKPVDVEREVAEWIDLNLACFINHSLSNDPTDVWLRAELVTLRPSVVEQL